MPDQFAYLEEIAKLKSGNLEALDFSTLDGLKRSRLYIATYLFNFIPLISYYGVHALAFANKLLAILLFVFLFNRVKTHHLIWVFLLPSFILYTSVSLRDFLIVFISTLSLVWMIEQKLIKSLIMILLILPLKLQNFPGLLFVWLAIFIIRADRSISLFCLLLSLSAILFFYFYESIIDQLFFYKIAFILENGVQLSDLDLESNILESSPGILEFLTQLPSNFFGSFLRPFPTEVSNPLILVIFLENIFIVGLFFVILSQLWYQKPSKRLMLIILFIGLSISLFVHAYTVFNLGSFARYKFGAFLPFLIVLMLLYQKNSKA
ncbi:hypothetical protein OAD45_00125 [Gammaproteobacteria bacterium]|nr:hypothetical protein [Gammaproteobacteria bacterium]